MSRRSVRLTNPDRVLFPAEGITKAELAAYYEAVAPVVLPHVRDRPVSLQRFRDGIGKAGFFQKDIGKGAPDWVRRIEVGKRGGTVCHPLAQDAATLVWFAQLNAITFHVPTWRIDDHERPDRVVIDLDPEPGDDFAHVRRAALAVGEQLRDAGLEPFAQVTGSKGIHVVAPLRRLRDYDTVNAFARGLAEQAARRDPRHLTTEFHKDKRGGRIFVDTGRNRPSHTAVPPYVVRPRPGAPVATPLRWEELEDPRLRPDAWTLRSVVERLDRLGGDPWADVRSAARAVPLPGARKDGNEA